MVSFSVELDQLINVHNQLVAVHANMQTIGSYAAGFDGQLGSPQIDAELANFADNWSNGFTMIQSRMIAVLTHLAGAIQAYHNTEASITKAATSSPAGGRAP